MYKFVKLSFALLFFLYLLGNTALPAKAESVNIKVTVDEGFNGKVKRGKGFPVSIKLENGGEAFSGDLLIQYNPSYNSGGSLAIHVELPKNSSKTYQTSVPGLIEDQAFYQNQSTIHLYKGSWEKGNEVTFQGEKVFKPKYIDPNERVVGVLSENYDRLKELRILPAVSIEMLPLTKEQLPKQGMGLEMIDYLIIDEYAVSMLDEQQQLAIKDWIGSGGVLVAGAAPDASESYGQLYSLLPMKLEGESAGTSDFLAGAGTDKPAFKEIPFFTGPVEKGAEILQTSGSLPAAIKKPFENGTILQTSFSLGDQPLASWNGYSAWFAKLLQEADQSTNTSIRNGQDVYDQLYWDFAETNEYFPSSHYSVGMLIVLLIVYLIVIVPILYLVLRKLDKREHSWWIIPSLAIVMSAVVFGIGAKDRIAQPQLNQMGVFQVKNNLLTGLQATTLLSNRSGDYRLSVPKDQYHAVPHINGSPGMDPSMGAVILEQRKVNETVFRNVGYWSSKTIYGKAQKETKGGFTADLSVKNNQLTGTVQNDFPYEFEEVFIWSGNQKINIGRIREGETLKIDQKIKQSFLTGPAMFSTAGMYQQKDLEKMKIEKLQYAASIFLNAGSNNQPLLGGVTKEAVVDVDITGKKEKQNNLNLILSPFTAESDFTGEFSLTTEMLATNVEVVKGLIHEKGMGGSPYEIMMEDGEYDYIVQLPEQLREKKVTFESVKFRMNGPFVQYSILNRETGEYLPIGENQNSFTLNKENHVEQYFSKEGELLIKVHKNSNGDPYVHLPQITVKGAVTP